MKFQSGDYFVGDLVRVLPPDALRMLMLEIIKYGGLKNLSSVKELIFKNKLGYYWIAKTPHITGSFYDQYNKAWGFDWGMFGVMPFDFVCTDSCYTENKVKFEKPFDFEATNDLIRIEHLIFTLNPITK